MAELASMIPLAGGPFNWVAILAPRYCRKYLSYLAGWLSVISYLALVSATCYVAGTLVQGLLILNYPSYVYENWHGTLLFYAVLFFGLFVNTVLGRVLPQIESLLLVFHILGFFAILIPIVYLAPQHQSASEVFGTFLNTGEYSSNFAAALVGMVTVTNSFPGLDAADHIAEEIHDAPRVIPIAIGTSTMLNGTMGFAMLLALLFCQPDDIQSTIGSDTFYPFINIYAYATQSNSGATALTAILICMIATSSRMIWAFAREGGLPFSKYLSRVDEKTRLPIWAIGVTTVISLLLALINIGSTVGFTAFISLVVAGYYSSFLLAASVMLHKRLTVPASEIPWGWFKLGRFGVPITVLSIAFTIIGGLFSFFPSTVDPTPETMNYCVLVYGSALLFSGVFWLLYGRKSYTGPIMETDA
ncbi:MAG: hypothetical protein Q9165_001115 [Trypethelium subeluteriae]